MIVFLVRVVVFCCISFNYVDGLFSFSGKAKGGQGVPVESEPVSEVFSGAVMEMSAEEARVAGLKAVQDRVEEVIAERAHRVVSVEPAGHSVKARSMKTYGIYKGAYFEISWKPAQCLSAGKLWVESYKWRSGIYTGCALKKSSVYFNDGWGVLENIRPFKNINGEKNRFLVSSSNYVYVGMWKMGNPFGNGRMHIFEEFFKGCFSYRKNAGCQSKFVWVNSFFAKFSSMEEMEIVRMIAQIPAKDFAKNAKILKSLGWSPL